MIRLEVIEGPEYAKTASGWEHRAYKVRLRRGGKSMTTPWMQGMAHTLGAPSAVDVLESLMLDASMYEGTRDFAEWASEYGYDAGTTSFADFHEAKRIYRQVAILTRRLKRFLGDDYEATATEEAHEAATRLVNAA